jgi:hypothetical protein
VLAESKLRKAPARYFRNWPQGVQSGVASAASERVEIDCPNYRRCQRIRMASATFANAPTTSRAGRCLFPCWDSNVRVVHRRLRIPSSRLSLDGAPQVACPCNSSPNEQHQPHHCKNPIPTQNRNCQSRYQEQRNDNSRQITKPRAAPRIRHEAHRGYTVGTILPSGQSSSLCESGSSKTDLRSFCHLRPATTCTSCLGCSLDEKSGDCGNLCRFFLHREGCTALGPEDQ